MVLILLWYWYTKFFSSLPSFKRICILTFLNSCTKKWNMILTPKCCTSYLFSETNINMKKEGTKRLLSLSLFYSVDSTCISYLIKTSWHATETKKNAERPRFKRQILTYFYAWTQFGRKYIIMFHFIFIKRIFIHATIQVTISVFQ